MKNKKGFTLVELLVVITIIGLLVVIAVPSGLTISKKVKRNMMDNKIEIIESGAIVWGQQNKSKIKNAATTETCIKNEINTSTGVTACIKKTIDHLLNTENALEEDGIDETNNKKILKNPTTDKSINSCEVEIYIKNKRVYAEYTKKISETDNLSICYYTAD